MCSMILHAVVIVIVAQSTLALPSYVANFPNSLIPGQPLNVQVTILQPSGAVNVDIKLQHTTNRSVIVSSSKSVMKGMSWFQLQVPDELLKSDYTVAVSGSGGLHFQNSSRIHYEDNNLFLFIQTDKTRYSAGQEIRFRGMFLLPNLLGYKGNVMLTVKDAKGNRVKVIGPAVSKDGVVTGKLQLSSEPVFGDWTITALARNKSTTKGFEVNAYILPKFSVSIDYSPDAKMSDPSFSIVITSRFTFKTNVSGNCTLEFYNEQVTPHHVVYHEKINGKVTFTVPMQDLKSKIQMNAKINIRAIVTDSATLLTMAAERELKFAPDKNIVPLTLSKTDTRDTFVPGLDYYTTIFLGRGKHPIGQSGEITVTPTFSTFVVRDCHDRHQSTKWIDILKATQNKTKLPFDESGLAHLKFAVPQIIDVIELYIEFGAVRTSIRLTPISRNSVAMLRIYPNIANTKVGDVVNVEVDSTALLNGNVYMDVFARGILLKTNVKTLKSSKQTSFSLTTTADMVPQCTILVYHTTDSGHLISDDVVLKVDGSPFNNELNVSFNATTLKPGEGIQMNFDASPNSTVYVALEDKKNRLLGSENDIYVYEITDHLDQIARNRTQNVGLYPMHLGKRNYIDTGLEDISKRAHGTHGDVDDVFIESGVIILTDAHMFEKTTVNDEILNSHLPKQCGTTGGTTGGIHPQSNTDKECIDDANFNCEMISSLYNICQDTQHAKDVCRKFCGVCDLVDGAWSHWSSWSNCDVTCSSGHKSRTRGCDNPPPANGALDCAGDTTVTSTCTLQLCPGGAALALADIVRSRFPETWIWTAYDLGPSGHMSVDLQVPDTITTWVTSVFATSPVKGFGISDQKSEIIVKKDFFVTMDLPESIVLGEEVVLQITAFNYKSSQITVFMNVTSTAILGNSNQLYKTIQPGQGQSTYIQIIPKDVGSLKINVFAQSRNLAVPVSDQLEKYVVVRPSGIFKTSNEQHLVDVSITGIPFVKSITFKDPPHVVNGTSRTKLSITGNFMVPSINGLQNLIRMPYGCGEQTMLNFAPDIYIAKYLKTVGKLTKAIETKSKSVLESGLQRELTYQHTDGSFSAFGNSDSSGSSWLTAFVLKCFQQANGLIHIDRSIQSKAMTWLLRYQNADGSFREPGGIVHTQMQAGTGSGIKITAFILISILENINIPGMKKLSMTNAISKGIVYLEHNLNSPNNDIYSLAIVCYALSKAQSTKATTCLTTLKQGKFLDDDKMYWKANSPTFKKRSHINRALSNRALSADIEATSYALLTFITTGHVADAFPIVKWLISQRNPQGGFASTQDTVISLQALSEYSSVTASHLTSGSYGVNFNAYSGAFHHAYSTTINTIDVVHEVELPSLTTNVIISAMGEGNAVVDVTRSYYVTGEVSSNVITIDPNPHIVKESLNSITIRPCFGWHGPRASGMIVMEVEMPTGFIPDNEVFKTQNIIKRHEIYNGRFVALYFDSVNVNQQQCVNVKFDRADPVVKNQACHITVYDYYTPTHQAMTRYQSQVLKSTNMCDVCTHCDFCSGSSGTGMIGK